MTRRRQNRGATLLEILLSMAIVLVGMLAMFAVLRSSITGSSTAQKISQAEARALTVMESIRQSPNAALDCLVTNSPQNWHQLCEPICKSGLGANAKPDSCIYSDQAFAALSAPDVSGANAYSTSGDGQTVDRSNQHYTVDVSPCSAMQTGGGSCVVIGGANASVYDIKIVIGWNDDGSANGGAGYHRVTLRSAVSTL